MGFKISKQYHLLNSSEKAIELEEYPEPPKKQYFSLAELTAQCQKLIILGFPLEVYELIRDNSIDVSALYLPLYSQQYLELISQEKYIDGLLFAQEFLSMHKKSSFVLETKTGMIEISITNLMGLLCYHQPKSSILGYLLDPSLRFAFALTVQTILNPPVRRTNICRHFKCCRKRTQQ